MWPSRGRGSGRSRGRARPLSRATGIERGKARGRGSTRGRGRSSLFFLAFNMKGPTCMLGSRGGKSGRGGKDGGNRTVQEEPFPQEDDGEAACRDDGEPKVWMNI